MRTSGVIVDTWVDLAQHGELCAPCGPVVAALTRIPDEPAAYFDGLCPVGQQLYTVHDLTKRALPAQPGSSDRLLATAREARRLLGMEGLSPSVAEVRASALARVPSDAFAALLKLPDAQREAQIRALERGAGYEAPAPEMTPRARPQWHRRAPRPTLMSTED